MADRTQEGALGSQRRVRPAGEAPGAPGSFPAASAASFKTVLSARASTRRERPGAQEIHFSRTLRWDGRDACSPDWPGEEQSDEGGARRRLGWAGRGQPRPPLTI